MPPRFYANVRRHATQTTREARHQSTGANRHAAQRREGKALLTRAGFGEWLSTKSAFRPPFRRPHGAPQPPPGAWAPTTPPGGPRHGPRSPFHAPAPEKPHLQARHLPSRHSLGGNEDGEAFQDGCRTHGITERPGPRRARQRQSRSRGGRTLSSMNCCWTFCCLGRKRRC